MDLRNWWIAENAYYRWLEAGCPDGRSEEFWYAAAEAYEDWLCNQGVASFRRITPVPLPYPSLSDSWAQQIDPF